MSISPTGLLVAGLLALGPAVPQAVAQSTASSSSASQPGAPNFADLVAQVAPAVVRVSVVGQRETQMTDIPPELRGTPLEEFFRRFGGQGQGPQQPRRAMGQGSGFIIETSGFVVTNNHVVGNARRVTVELADGRELPARVVGADPQTDIALLKVEAGGSLPSVSWGPSADLRVGESVLAMGNPFGLGGTATSGIVSARGRQIGAGPYDDFIQTDASINPGNSGGPLFNMRGQVVGVNTAIFSPSGGNIGIGFAVPSQIAQRVVTDLREDGRVERGWLGVSLQNVDRELAEALGVPDAEGALIAGVEPGSPAARGGLRAGDVVTRAGDRQVQDSRDLAVAVGEASPGATITLTLRRDGEQRQQQVTLSPRPDQRDMAGRGGDEQGERSTGAVGLALAARQGAPGAAVVRVAPGSIAEERGIRAGDVILRAGGRDVTGPGDVSTALEEARKADRSSIAIQIQRGNASTFVALPLRRDQG
ncbi:Do family serine endopeptidase [Falsiroseomonas sp. E2-1-a20]|uniref:Do family serine endopeptidase n=1 Tax=Falsiroseomonas sp. E2-1-a20 TaxID=3239300 RepID=UPI003F36D136